MKPTSISLKSGATLLLLSFSAACSSGSGSSSHSPTVTSSSPAPGATGVPINAGVGANFSETMDSSTLTTTTFTLTFGAGAVPVPGTVVYADSTAVFWPSEHLADNGTYTATVTTGAEDSSGVPIAEDHSWSFDTGNTTAPGTPVDLGTAENFAILAKSGISTVPASVITGDIGASPVTSTAITQFSETLDASNEFSTSTQVTGNIYASDYAPPTPQYLITAVLDMEHACTDAAARAPDVTELGAGSISTAMALPPGVYKWGTGLGVTADVTLPGSSTDVWIFQIAQDFIVSSSTEIRMTGAALPENVFWQVSGLVDLDTTSRVDGIILCSTGITLKTGATVNGRLLAQTLVALDHSTVTEPAP
jgi:hypothetical protein